jgi:hypothetical protein
MPHPHIALRRFASSYADTDKGTDWTDPQIILALLLFVLSPNSRTCLNHRRGTQSENGGSLSVLHAASPVSVA